MAHVTTYSAAAVTCMVGSHVVEGLGTGDDAIMVTMSEDMMSKNVGIKGDVTFSQATDRSGEVTIRLLAGASSNEFLTAKCEATASGTVFSAPIIITESGSNSKVTANKCVILRMPDFQRGTTAAELEWQFLAADIAISHTAGSEL